MGTIIDSYDKGHRLTCRTDMSIITFTRVPGEEDGRGASQTQFRQATDLTPAGNPQSSSARCSSPALPSQRLLRSRRSAADQVRDAARGPRGTAAGFANRARVWPLPAVVLPGASEFRARRLVRIAAPQAGSQERTQAYRHGSAVRGRAARSATGLEFRATDRVGETEVRAAGASPQYRAAVVAGKKTLMKTPSLVPTATPGDKSVLIGAYEELRRRFLSRQYGPGLTILMRRGLREWMNTCSSYLDPPAISVPAPPHDETIFPQGVRAELVGILGGMLLHRCQEASS